MRLFLVQNEYREGLSAPAARAVQQEAEQVLLAQSALVLGVKAESMEELLALHGQDGLAVVTNRAHVRFTREGQSVLWWEVEA